MDEICGESMKKYFEEIQSKIKKEYEIAENARRKNYDPEDHVEISLAKNMAERVLGLILTVAPQIKNTNFVKRIQELEKNYGILDWRVSFKIAEELAEQKICRFESQREAIEVGIRAGFAYATVGVVSACLEGFTKLEIKKRRDGGEYFCLWFSGPIRNAGGTAASQCILIADYIRNKLGYGVYDPDENEINRYYSEVEHYNDRCIRVQYMPSKEEMEFLVKRMPIEISGDSTEKIEVPNYKNLPRVHTNLIRSGMCLIMSSCIPLKAPKLWKQLCSFDEEFKMKQWDFIGDFIKLQKKITAKIATKISEKDEKISEKLKISPNFTYIEDIVGGRPVLGHPMMKGGLRLRYGRSRASGLSGQSIHPATMQILNKFVAIGTQLRVERPGKAAVYTPCETIEGPIVKLKNGNVVYVNSEKLAKQVSNEVEEILFLGDVLICYGDFINRAHILIPPGYCEEWWVQELEKSIVDNFGSLDTEKVADIADIDAAKINEFLRFPLTIIPSQKDAIKLSLNLNVPLHPFYTFHWKDISIEQLNILISSLKKASIHYSDNDELKKIIIPYEKESKRVLEEIGVPHILSIDYVVIEKDCALSFFKQMGDFEFQKFENLSGTVFDRINLVSDLTVRDKSGIYIGCRMGRPEKGKMRRLKGSPHGLFPVGEEGGVFRSFQSALGYGKVKSSFPLFYCEKCDGLTIYASCEICSSKTLTKKYCKTCGIVDNCVHNPFPSQEKEINIRYYFEKALEKLNTKLFPDMIKGVRGTINREHILEYLPKSILRAKYNVYVNKDGTIRYDATEIPLTHFKPGEINVSINKLKQLGYEKDIYGIDLENEEQILELKVQDVLIPCCPDIDDPADEVLLKATNFIDELLEKVYGLPRYYNCQSYEDLIGILLVGLAPHTSAGTVIRVIGFSKSQGLLAHPLFHCAVRRDCDGDEAGFFLLLDGLLNFSKKYLPNTRGATMDAPLVLSSTINPTEVDDMAFDMDTVFKYPLEFYNACMEYKMPWEVKIECVRNRLGKQEQYSGYGFTHENGSINSGVLISSYKTLPTMEDKVLSQMDVAAKIRAVNTADVASLVINKHFLKDTKGNLRKFSQQMFRCVKCGTKFRRPPLSGKCCEKGKIIFTVSEGSVTKYLGPSLSIVEKFDVGPYMKQNLEILRDAIESTFGRERDKQSGLGEWFA